MVKNPPAVQKMHVRSLGQKDPLEEEIATHSSILAWEIPCIEEPGGLQSMGSEKSGTTERLNNCNVIGKEVISVDNKVTVPVDIYINNQVLILSWSQKT